MITALLLIFLGILVALFPPLFHLSGLKIEAVFCQNPGREEQPDVDILVVNAFQLPDVDVVSCDLLKHKIEGIEEYIEGIAAYGFADHLMFGLEDDDVYARGAGVNGLFDRDVIAKATVSVFKTIFFNQAHEWNETGGSPHPVNEVLVFIVHEVLVFYFVEGKIGYGHPYPQVTALGCLKQFRSQDFGNGLS